MKIRQHSDFGLRVLLYLGARPGQRVKTRTIADAFEISSHHLQKVVRSLGKIGVVSLYRGANGGIELSKSPKDISIGYVMRHLDGGVPIVECFDKETSTCKVAGVCGLTPAFRAAQEAFYQSLDKVALSSMVSGKKGADLRRATDGSLG